VVEQDEREGSLRKSLNFGHTAGHAIEALADYRVMHGFAVALGMRYEARLAARLGIMPPTDVGRLEALLDAVGYPRGLEEIFPNGAPTPQRMVEAMRADKKARAGRIEMALPARIGAMHTTDRGHGIAIEDGDAAAMFEPS
jgi:3-dehydroquinate synthase